MTFATKMLPGPTLNPVEDSLERPAPGPEPTPSRDQVAGKEGHSMLPKVAEKGIKRGLKLADTKSVALDIEWLELSLNTVHCSSVSCRKL